ncbi:hypothetical protein GALMADRAFT_239528 [Galerina marginata CBS 339.88]|uniref:BD-FAE-like domain-containing protein n=1 Tax=Galerina marginata (strain CBS 339.88) TaxID=685588 RepID=A0A067TNQ1_GALM3|nr:hypothetical protein GALMADRAFT_239528 [Galerina marginata CBS 339.88]
MENIGYSESDDPQRQFDIYWPQPSIAQAPLVCFIHGGAWRAEDKRDHAQLARSLVIATACPVAVPNYRLTPSENADPQFHHPMHAEDVLQFLVFVRKWHHESCPFDPDRLILLGHSCSAHMLSSIFLNSDGVSPSLTPAQDLLASVKAIVVSEGIYDLDSLITRFPGYRDWFVQSAFGPSESYPQFSVLRYPLRPSSAISWLLLHSRGDSLVDIPQTEAMHTHLMEIHPQGVSINIDELTDEHNDILRTDLYVKIVKEFTAKFI